MPDNNRVMQANIGVGVLVWRNRQLLLGKRINSLKNNCWQFPGGHLEDGETVLECAAREVMEETGIAVNGLRHLDFTDRILMSSDQPYLTLFVSCQYLSGEAVIKEPDKCEIWKWFDYQHLPAPLFAATEIMLSQQNDLYSRHLSAPVIGEKV